MNKTGSLGQIRQRLLGSGSSGLVYIMLGMVWVLSIIVVPGFFTLHRSMQLLQTASFLAIVSAGQTVAVITNGIDYSVSGVMTMSACVCGALIMGGMGTFLAVVITLSIAVLVGILNSLGINFLKIPTLIMTIAMVTILEGATLIWTGGYAKNGQSPFLQKIGQGALFGIVPYMVFLCAGIYILLYWLLHKTRYGRYFYSVSTNERASELSGIAIKRVRMTAMIISSGLAAVTGIMLYSYLGYNYLTLGSEFHIQTVAAVVLGGTAITGGSGRIFSTIAGSLIFVIIADTISAVNIAQSYREMIQGLLIVIMLFLYARERVTN